MRFPNSNQPQVGSLAGIGSLGFGGVGTNTQAAPYMMGQPMAAMTSPSLGFGSMAPTTAPAPVYTPGVAPAAPVNNLLTPSIESLSTPVTEAGFDVANQFGVTGNDALSNGLTNALDNTGGMGGLFKSTFLNKDGGLNVGNITGLLSSIAGIYGGFQQLGLAKDSLALSKETFKVNTENQKKSYNTALEDRASGRYSDSNPDRGKADDYLKRNRL